MARPAAVMSIPAEATILGSTLSESLPAKGARKSPAWQAGGEEGSRLPEG